MKESSRNALIFAGPRWCSTKPVARCVETTGGREVPRVLHELQPEPAGQSLRTLSAMLSGTEGRRVHHYAARDLFFAWTEIIGRIVKFEGGGTVTTNASSK